MRIRAALVAALLPVMAAAQEPRSAIEWLSQKSGADSAGPVLLEPPVTETGLQPDVQVSSLDSAAPAIGLVPPAVTGLPVDLWRASDAEALARLIAEVPVRDSPAMQTLLFTLLLTEAAPPAAADADQLFLARIDRLLELGAADPAQALAELADPTRDPALFARWFDATLLTGDEDRGCAILQQTPRLAPDYAAQIFCAVRAGDWQTAALTLEAAHALELLPPSRLALLDRFLSPEIFEDAPPLPVGTDLDPLAFRLYEAIGEPLPTGSLPRRFASADLRDIAGWKAQLEAAERLSRIGALAPNQLLGLYTARLPAASGGIWDRVAALQRFESALSDGDGDAVARTLPPVWDAMRQSGLEVPFATLFADQLSATPLPEPETALLAWRIQLLSPQYENAARSVPGQSDMDVFLAALAQGDPGRVRAPEPIGQAIAAGFAEPAPVPPDLARALAAGRLGETVLRAMALFARGAQGNPDDLSSALATFRAVGLEDTARRAALQLLLLERH